MFRKKKFVYTLVIGLPLSLVLVGCNSSDQVEVIKDEAIQVLADQVRAEDKAAELKVHMKEDLEEIKAYLNENNKVIVKDNQIIVKNKLEKTLLVNTYGQDGLEMSESTYEAVVLSKSRTSNEYEVYVVQEGSNRVLLDASVVISEREYNNIEKGDTGKLTFISTLDKNGDFKNTKKFVKDK